MPTIRFSALRDLSSRVPLQVPPPSEKISNYFGINVFNKARMREYLTEEAFNDIMGASGHGKAISRSVADQVAAAMKDWAISKGVTHYTHWFQPLTGSTAEKHDAFLQLTDNGSAIERFEGNLLVQQEPDASSFPNGGIRNTFEARGYTAWDSSSPAFIISKTLCIPTVFISYTGEALDYKLPLLKALEAVNSAATDVCQYFDKRVSQVTATLGWEQEYFLVDKALYNARPDLIMTGRVLIGNNPAKGQQLDDHYFGTIPDRAHAFMRDYENEALKLGIPVTTRHNEVAPNQFECAPIFEETNLANDHNLLLMDLLDKVAKKHNFRALLHEKPFSGLNGSGKHNNWSLATDTGVNLLAPGKTPKTNLQFLTFLVNTIKAIYDNADILRASIASASNDYRLGANEAPPAIVSVFIGEHLTKMLDEIEMNIKAGKMTPEAKTELKLSIGNIPQLLMDNTDRNRTSPFAFTGNKFEFRAAGSSANCASPMIALNTIVAKQLKDFKIAVDIRMTKGTSKDESILKELQLLIKQSKSIRFEQDGYGDEWVKESKKRGLANLKDTPRALAVMVRADIVDLFAEMKVLSKTELYARQEVELENYILKLQIEARILGELIINHVIPAAVKYQNKLIENVIGLNTVFDKETAKKTSETQTNLIQQISEHMKPAMLLSEEMVQARKKANRINDTEKRALEYCDKVKPFFDKIKYHSDKLESIIEDEIWPLPKYREMLFTK